MMDTEGFDELRTQIAAMASALDTEGAGSAVTRIILENAAVPVHEQMKQNASKDPKIITGALHGAINIRALRRWWIWPTFSGLLQICFSERTSSTPDW